VPVSLLELETQAEVDKYAATVFLIASQQGGAYLQPGAIRACFDRVGFDARLEPEQYHRYRNRQRSNGAARYCRRLEHHYRAAGRGADRGAGAGLKR